MAVEGDSFKPISVSGIKPNTKEWLKERRAVTASSAAAKCGASADASAQLEADWEINHPGEDKPDNEKYMIEGHEKEDPVARRCAKILFPHKEMLGPNVVPEGECGLKESTLYLHPDHQDWISSTPDRDVIAHPEKRVIMEIKYSRHLLRERPKVDHVMQCCTQMMCLKVDYMFLGYGHMDDCTSVFLIQNSPRLWAWMHQRHLIYYEYIKKKQIPPKEKIPCLGHAIKEYWTKGTIPQWIKTDFAKVFQRPDFFPAQPKWQLVGYDINEETCSRYAQDVEKYSPSGGVDPIIFQRAIGSIWKRIGVEVGDNVDATGSEMVAPSMIDDIALKAHINSIRGDSNPVSDNTGEEVLIKTLWEGRVENLDDNEYQLPVKPLKPLAREFIKQIGIHARVFNSMKSDDGEALARRFLEFIKSRYPKLALFIQETDEALPSCVFIELGLDVDSDE